MAQDGTTAGGSSYTIDNVTFPVGRTKLQSIFDAIRSTNIGNTAPDLVAGQFWIDNNTPSTTVWTLYLYDGTDNISFATIDTINNTVNFLDSTFDLINDTTPQLGGTLDANGNNIDMGTNLITDTKVGQWDTAYSWGDHSTQGYLTSETDSQTLSFSNPNLSISNGNSVDLSALNTGILNVSEDTTPQLGGNLDLNSNDITGTGDINITGSITSNGVNTSSFNSVDISGELNLNATGTNIIDFAGTDTNVRWLNSSPVFESVFTATRNGEISLKYNGAEKLATTSTGIDVTGTITSSGDITTSGVLNSIAPTRHSIRPSLNLDFANSKALDPRITFTRASNATYYDGYTSVKAEENLVTYSQEFDNAIWLKTSASITANDTTAPDGTTTAELLYPVSSTCYIYQSRNTNGNPIVISVYAKAQNKSVVYLFHYNSAQYGVYYLDTSDGSTSSTSGSVTTGTMTATDVGNGWYRFSVYFSSSFGSGNSNFGIGVSDAKGSITVTPNSTDGIHIWGAQLEQRDSLTAYTPTTSSPITKYQPALQTAGNNVARFDHNPATGESLGLLIEESRTNLFVRSEELNTWSSVNSPVIRTNQIIAPDGTLTADKYIVPDGITSGNTSAYLSSTITADATFTVSIYAKSAGLNNFSFFVRDSSSSSNSFSAYFDLSNGTTGTLVAGGTATVNSISIEDVGNGWYRCIATGSIGNSATTIQARVINRDTGNGFDGYFFWGMQLEVGSFPTSYIKTTGSTVTRSNDLAVMNNIDTSDWYNQKEGAVLVETAPFNPNNGYRPQGIHISDGTSSERIAIHTGLNGHLYIRTSDGVGANLTVSSSGVTANTFSKYSASWELNNVAVSVNGSVAVEDTNCSLPRNINKINIMAGATGSVDGCSSWVKKLAFYPIRLTNNELQDLSEE